MTTTNPLQILTKQGEELLARLAAEEKELVIDKFIFADVPDRGEFPSREEAIPHDYIVHEEPIGEKGRLTENSVIYTATLASDVGPFYFNWSGLYCSEHNVLVTIHYPKRTPKTQDQPGIAGNTLVRSQVLQYTGVAEITNITVDASTWQYNSNDRLKKMDADVAQALIDQNGKDWFIGDGFQVLPKTDTSVAITPGAGYVSGNRVSLGFERIISVPTKPAYIYLDAKREGTPTGEQITTFNFVVSAEEKDDYIDTSTGKQTPHFVCKIAQVLEDGSVSDLRPEGESAGKEWVNKNAGYETKNPILRNIGDKLRENSSVRDMGENQGDDTENIKALSSVGSIDDSDAHYFVIQKDHTLLSTEDDKKMSLLGASFKVLPHDYSAGYQPGDWARYTFIHSKASRNTAIGMTFDGNGEFTNSTHLPDEVNIHFQPMSFYGEGREERTKNNRALFNDVLGCGGHSYMWGNSDNAWMCFNYASGHAGSGMAGGNRNAIMMGNILQDGLDAHLVANTAENVLISGNVTDMNANGGVCDIAGSKTVAFTANVGCGGTNTGVWVIKSPNSGETYQDVTVTANLLKNNSRYPHRWQGEITAGFREPTEEFSGENLSILSNHLHSVNNGVDLVDNAVVFVGYGTKKTVFANNAIFGTTTLNFPTYQFRGAEDVAVLNNTCWQDRQALAWFEDCKGRIVWKDNVNSRVHPESPQVPSEMVAQDGRIFYSIVRKLNPLQGIIAFEIKMPGGITNDIVELRVTQQGSTGIVHKRLYVEGHELAVPIIHQEDTLAKVGALPPDVVINREIGKFVITCRNEHPTTALNLSFSIEITTQDDKSSRLVPKFIPMSI
ncbi:phage tail protein [Vibrio vulnificus]|uniref:phage tail-collar fiber domain-containing protein n=1 Tax=Vibrio vulnificus TaxID=672 RepID=UPI0040589620